MIVRQGSLNTKTVFSLLFPLILYALVTAVFQRALISPSFTDLELIETGKNIDRCISALEREQEHLAAITTDWAAFNETYDFVQGLNPGYISDNLNLTTYNTLNLNFIYYYNLEGKLVWGKGIDLSDGSIIELEYFRHVDGVPFHDLLCSSDDSSAVPEGRTGLINTADGPVLLSAMPVLTSQDLGPYKGTLIFGRLLNESNLGMLREQTKIPFELYPLPDFLRLSPRNSYLYKRIEESGADWISDINNNDSLDFYAVIRNLHSVPAFIITASIQRDIVARGRVALQYAWVSIVISWSIITVFLLLLIRNNVLKPVKNLTDHILRMEETGNLAENLRTETGDEIGLLVREFNTLTDQINESNAQLTKMAAQKDLLFSVLSHDLRTPFSTISAASYLLDDAVKTGNLEEIGLCNKSIMENVGKGEALLARILDWISAQRDRKGEINTEPVPVSVLVGDALAYIKDRACGKDITISCGNFENYTVSCEQNSIGTCLRNILGNAVKFTGEGGRVSITARNEEQMTAIEIADTGTGLSSDQIEKILNSSERFSSTGTAGETGNGLGLMMTLELLRMNNSELKIRSRPGEGAVFTILLPSA